jgi:hypothetical protein
VITAEYVRSSAVAAAPMTVGCTYCLAPRGSHCRSKGGYQNSLVGYHKARRSAVAHLSEQQRYDAYVVMRGEEARLRAHVSRLLEQPLTPQQQESRRRQRAAWAQAGREATVELRQDSRPRRLALTAVRGGAPVVDLTAERARRRNGSTPSGAA